jgi:hypothetical protein
MSAPHDSESGEGAPLTLPSVEILAGGVTLEWLEDRQILVFCAPNSSRSAIQALYDRAEAILLAWPVNRPHLSILDLRSATNGTTAYTRERGKALSALRPDVRVCTALLSIRSLQGHLLQMMVRAAQRPNKEIAVHFSLEEAITWLKREGGIS